MQLMHVTCTHYYPCFGERERERDGKKGKKVFFFEAVLFPIMRSHPKCHWHKQKIPRVEDGDSGTKAGRPFDRGWDFGVDFVGGQLK